MNTPLPTAAPQVPVAASDPTTPGNKPAPSALGSAATAAVAGTPLAILSVWLIESYGTVKGASIKLDAETATAIGAVGASVIGYVVAVLQGVLALLTSKLPKP